MIKSIEREVDNGANIVILSDRGVSNYFAPIPILLACAHAHNALKRLKKRSNFGIVIESAEPREPHHFSCLFGYGASAINPYMVNEIIETSRKWKHHRYRRHHSHRKLQSSNSKGIIKVMNKIGISTLHLPWGTNF